MTIYQKAIRIRKTCESKDTCMTCKYHEKCIKSRLIFMPRDESLKELAFIIEKEEWNVK